MDKGPTEDQPSGDEKPPLTVNVNGLDDGSVQIDFSIPLSRLSFQPDEALGFCMAVQHAVTAILQKQKKDAKRK